jgi:hypothetical protein
MFDAQQTAAEGKLLARSDNPSITTGCFDFGIPAKRDAKKLLHWS